MIREAQIEDVAKINELGLLVNDKFTNLFMMENIINETISKVLVYVKNKEVIAFMHVTQLYETVDIINIVVDPKYRRQNIASSLFDYLLSELPTSVKLITLEVNKNNDAAINFYEKFGFEIISIRKNYYGGKEDAYLMGRKL